MTETDPKEEPNWTLQRTRILTDGRLEMICDMNSDPTQHFTMKEATES